MAKYSLIPFDSQNGPWSMIESELNHNHDSIFLSFRIRKGLEFIDFGETTPHKDRVFNLWSKTCFEFFIKNQNGQYLEFNFSANFEWNCFYFEKKGAPISEWTQMLRPKTDILASADHFLLFTEIKKIYFPIDFFKKNLPLKAQISAVIKNQNGILSYWAIKHADSKPNFHHFDSFIEIENLS